MPVVGFTNIGSLVTNDVALERGRLGELADAAFAVEHGAITWVGSASQLPACDELVDLRSACVLPGFVDSHAHLLFAGDRADEFAARMSGESYTAGGIRRTVAATRAASDEMLTANLARLNAEYLAAGVTTYESKTGYGLSVEEELRGLQLLAGWTDEVTLLAAHVVPPEFVDQPDAYVDLIIDELLPAARGQAKWFDVFCDRGAFDEAQTRRLLTAAAAAGFALRLHANQLEPGPGVRLAVEFDAASADHCSHLSDSDVEQLAASDTVATLLPAAEFSTRSQYPSGRRLMDAGVKVAIATDCNPGSSYTTSMSFAIALAVREMGMSPAEAVWAATAGGAAALRRADIGRIAVGASADFVALAAPSPVHIAYRPGVPLVVGTWRRGRRIWERMSA